MEKNELEKKVANSPFSKRNFIRVIPLVGDYFIYKDFIEKPLKEAKTFKEEVSYLGRGLTMISFKYLALYPWYSIVKDIIN